AAAAARTALALDPADAAGWRVLSGIQLSGGDGSGARTCAWRAARVRPNDAAARTALGAAEARCGRTRAAERALATALALDPQGTEACNNLGIALLAGRHPERARRALARAQTLAGLARAATSNLLLALNYDPAVDDDDLAAAHRAWGAAVARPRPPARVRHERLRLGYISPDLKRHPVGYLAAAALEHRDRGRFDVHVFSDVRTPDDLTARLRAAIDDGAWHDSAGWSDADLEAAVRRAGIDILVDLAGHTADNRLAVFAAKPAPVQVSWLGYFHTTGLPTIDALFTDDASVPPEQRGWFTERVVPLASGRFCYTPPQPGQPVAPPPLPRRGFPTFGSFNNLSKLTPAVVALWAELLKRAPTARLVLKWHTLGDDEERAALRAAFAAHGIDPGRLDLRGASPHDAMLAEYADIDVALDPFPFCGCLTTLEALWMGVPVVTLEGRRPVARQSLAILRQIGHPDLVAATPEAYLDVAARLVADPAALAARRAALRADMAAGICDAARFTAAFEAALLEVWQGAG
ncbi:O-linked N-acetylglucosamine transferase, partial [Azospirillum sp. TSO22-1]|uniref:O-linked N-acetylglucosamine transferase, SPINDLY family protein n=1 Tax=Azospirillum sp. TSO22-1 TaxID=716789 RepID=UPI000D658895